MLAKLLSSRATQSHFQETGARAKKRKHNLRKCNGRKQGRPERQSSIDVHFPDVMFTHHMGQTIRKDSSSPPDGGGGASDATLSLAAPPPSAGAAVPLSLSRPAAGAGAGASGGCAAGAAHACNPAARASAAIPLGPTGSIAKGLSAAPAAASGGCFACES